jgi:class 3 adenylate cyclase/pimeloyl-ACP methyl ester carboxylesterase
MEALMMGEFPDVRYASADGVSIAYCTLGDGPNDLVLLPGLLHSVLSRTVDPQAEEWVERCARFSRLIQLDRRGLGMSDPIVAGGAPPLEQQVQDTLAVMDAAGSERAALMGTADGGMVALLFAAMHPERVSALVLSGAWATVESEHENSPTLTEANRLRRTEAIRSQWGDLENPWGLQWLRPSRRGDSEFPRVLARVQQVGASRAAAVETLIASDGDVSAAFPLVQVPTLVLCASQCRVRAGALRIPEHARLLADSIPDARLFMGPGGDAYFGRNVTTILGEIEEFLTGIRPVPVSDRILATVLFTDIVGSTGQLAALGDEEWHIRLDRHDEMVRSHLQHFNGREIKTTGDGFFATFDGPARAVRCAQSIASASVPLGLEVRAGVHVGECEVRGDDLAGIAVHIGARVSALAGSGEVLTTSTVRDLVAGSGINFTDRGLHVLKGVPGEWSLLAAEAPSGIA